MMQLILGKWVTRPIHVAAELGIADLLANGPLNTADLATATGTHAPSLYRLMRALSSIGIFTESAPHSFALTALGESLCSDQLRPQALLFGSRWHDQAWSELLHSVRTGEAAFEKAFGQPAFDWLQAHPEAAELFASATAANISSRSRAVVDSYDFSSCTRVVDLGGGRGALLIEILTRYPQVSGIVADLPAMVRTARQAIAEADLGSRCDAEECDFFRSVPATGDTYILSDVLHDWGDDQCRQILKRCHGAMDTASKLLVVGFVIPPGDQPSPAKLLDLEMLVMGGDARERTVEELQHLLEVSGFNMERVIPTPDGASIIEATPVS
jgi:cyclopropane fatty-acyl-phospholipid synthase-like methyltransferase